jgi:hypothetical protein
MLIFMVVWADATATKPMAMLRPITSLFNFIQVSFVGKNGGLPKDSGQPGLKLYDNF